jgi:hypothetical protein
VGLGRLSRDTSIAACGLRWLAESSVMSAATSVSNVPEDLWLAAELTEITMRTSLHDFHWNFRHAEL